MPRKQQGWITFQSSEEERQLLEQYCQQTQRTKTDILRELLRGLDARVPPSTASSAKQAPVEEIEARSPGIDRPSVAIKVSARNLLEGLIKRLVVGRVSTEVILEIAPGLELVSTITTASAEELGLKEGQRAYAVIKSSNVMMATELILPALENPVLEV